MLGRLGLVTVTALMTGTAVIAQPAPDSPPEPEATGSLELVQIKPSDGSHVTAGTSLVAELRYKVDPFVKGRYSVMPQFATTRPGVTTSGDLQLPLTAFAVKEPSGSLTVTIPVSRILEDKRIARPVELRFLLNSKWGSPISSPSGAIVPLRSLAATEPVHYIPK